MIELNYPISFRVKMNLNDTHYEVINKFAHWILFITIKKDFVEGDESYGQSKIKA